MARGVALALGEGRLLRARELLRVAEDRATRDRPPPGGVLPVAEPLARLLPGGALRRGTVVALAPERARAPEPGPAPRAVRSRPPSIPRGAPPTRPGTRRVHWRATGVTSLLWSLVAEASAGDAWIGIVGRPELGLVAAAEAGVRLERLALVPDAGEEPLAVVSALLDGLDVVVVGSAAAGTAPTVRDRLAARARQRGSVLLVLGPWPGADLLLTCGDAHWLGIGPGGSGRLRERRASVRVRGRGTAAAGRGGWVPLPVPRGSAPAHPDPAGRVGGRPDREQPGLERPAPTPAPGSPAAARLAPVAPVPFPDRHVPDRHSGPDGRRPVEAVG